MGRGVRTECTADIPLETKFPPCDGYPGTSGRQVRVTVCVVGLLVAIGKCLVLSAAFLRGNGVTRRTQKVIQGGDNGHVGRPERVLHDAQ
jgi:hypothetical protein